MTPMKSCAAERKETAQQHPGGDAEAVDHRRCPVRQALGLRRARSISCGTGRPPSGRMVRPKLTAAGLQPSPPAAAATLCRRIYLDLTGLPPSPGRWRTLKLQSARIGRQPSRSW
nr:DUF1549 domain-containing protein [Verrucomicrobium spinosum]